MKLGFIDRLKQPNGLLFVLLFIQFVQQVKSSDHLFTVSALPVAVALLGFFMEQFQFTAAYGTWSALAAPELFQKSEDIIAGVHFQFVKCYFFHDIYLLSGG